ncbi:hypothetical protein [uncultured Flavobacterium sp.]|uniref:hypothetical protein n=1 Tax=uncultured Flavobacterium sp. TaxID=165435 RepID=UPI0025F716FA|nr:hypothetical protein [uncultured Flavobacterium sp.]
MERPIRNNRRRKPFFLLIIAGIFILGAVVMLLWNAILPDVLGVAAVNYWQALGILVLSKILFGGFRFGQRGNRGGFGNPRFKEKFMNMSREERIDFRNEWKERFHRRKDNL